MTPTFGTAGTPGVDHAASKTRRLLRLAIALAVAASLLFVLINISRAQSPVGQLPTDPDPTPANNFYLLTRPSSITETKAYQAILAGRPPTYYVIASGDTLASISVKLDVSLGTLLKANALTDANRLEINQILLVPGGDGTMPTVPATLTAMLRGLPPIAPSAIVSRMTESARSAPITSPFYKTTWVTYYGRPSIPQMGIVGEHDVVTLTKLLLEKAKVVDEANGEELRVKPAFHLVYGMATVETADDGSHLDYVPDDVVMQYVNAGLQNNIGVILDIQVGALTPTESISRALKFLKYPNVHIALDPEFAMSHPGQTVPGNPIGFVTGAQVNDVQRTIQKYLEENKIRGRRILMVHQFFDEMIEDKQVIRKNNPRVELTYVADGFGDPYGKIGKYNGFFPYDGEAKYTAFKIFWQFDEPVLSDKQALGLEPYGDLIIGVTPNVLIYQ